MSNLSTSSNPRFTQLVSDLCNHPGDELIDTGVDGIEPGLGCSRILTSEHHGVLGIRWMNFNESRKAGGENVMFTQIPLGGKIYYLA